MVPASVLGGNIAAYQKNNFNREFPGGSDTGIGRRSNPNLTLTLPRAEP